MPQRQQTGASFAFVMLMIWMLMPMGDVAGPAGPLLSEIAGKRLAKYRGALDVLNRTQWGDFTPAAKETPHFVNITGFREIDGFAWEDLDRFKEKSLQLSHMTGQGIFGTATILHVAAGRVYCSRKAEREMSRVLRAEFRILSLILTARQFRHGRKCRYQLYQRQQNSGCIGIFYAPVCKTLRSSIRVISPTTHRVRTF
ncbi:hypothetical protein NQ176_g6737 [Zarea fungicola]|uniref:Uncharacterized protein n=1 Tax=Zarea fungicola TaxID=93591 RepID=A0ACC1N1R2_9HYPO|nr:hypothetical protein NQ176_g6737 [Lecanicillium fungicola]